MRGTQYLHAQRESSAMPDDNDSNAPEHDDEQTPEGQPDGEHEDNDGDDESLGDQGRKALETERARGRKARQALAPWQGLAREFGVTPDQARELLRKATGTDDAVEQARRTALSEATSRANARIVRSEVRAIAAETFADPADAVAFLDVSTYEVDDDGEVDSDAIRADLVDLLKRKPHLSKSGAPKPDRSQGAKGSSPAHNDPARAFGASLSGVLG